MSTEGTKPTAGRAEEAGLGAIEGGGRSHGEAGTRGGKGQMRRKDHRERERGEGWRGEGKRGKERGGDERPGVGGI